MLTRKSSPGNLLAAALLLVAGAGQAQVVVAPHTPLPAARNGAETNPDPRDDQAKPDPRFPLRLHLLAVDSTHHTVRLQPNWCATSLPSMGGDAGGNSPSSDPCGGGNNSTSLGGGDDDIAGSGRGDLVTTPSGAAQGLTYTYEGCPRVRVPPGFEGLPARWKKPGKLEVLIPSDAIVTQKGGDERSLPAHRCTLTVTLHDFVYLRLPNGSMLTVTQDAYLLKPSLRRFLSGPPEALHSRTPATVSVKQLMQKPE